MRWHEISPNRDLYNSTPAFKKKKKSPFPILRFINLPQSNLAVLPFRTETCLHLLAVRSFPIAFSSRPAAGPHESDAVPSCSCSRKFCCAHTNAVCRRRRQFHTLRSYSRAVDTDTSKEPRASVSAVHAVPDRWVRGLWRHDTRRRHSARELAHPTSPHPTRSVVAARGSRPSVSPKRVLGGGVRCSGTDIHGRLPAGQFCLESRFEHVW